MIGQIQSFIYPFLRFSFGPRDTHFKHLHILFRFLDYENMLEETWNMDLALWDSFGLPPMVPKKEEKIGLAEAIVSSILSAGMCCDALSYSV